MSQIKLKHSGGNSVIIAAPSSNPASDRTLTLPSDADGTIVSKDTANNLANIASINGGFIGTKNLIINGAMNVAQYGTIASIGSGYHTVDRFKVGVSGLDQNPTHSQADVASGTTPYSLGFRKCFKLTNGNQTSGAGAADVFGFNTTIEARDMAASGWNYTDPNSFITLSFWVKSSVAQNFYGNLINIDTPMQGYTYETGNLTANTWTKITKTIPGNSNIVFNNDSGNGLLLEFIMYRGTSFTGSVTLDAWRTYDSNVRMPDYTSTWYTTDDATFEITGIQLEVGSSASAFAHESYADTLRKCQRYLYKIEVGKGGGSTYNNLISLNRFNTGGAGAAFGSIFFPVEMRTEPTFSYVGNAYSAGGYAGAPVAQAASKQIATLKSTNTISASQSIYLRVSTSGDLDLLYSAEF